jgi:MYXO-CTERM domain-containing protein
VFQALYSVASQISWALTDDAGGDGEPSPGDTVTFTIHVENSGNAPGMVAITNEIPAEAASWQLVDAGGGDDASDADTLVVDGLALGAGESADVVFSLVIDEVPDQTVIVDMAALDGGAAGTVDLVAPEVLVRRDGDADAVFDADDNCPEDSNPDQADADDDGVGDACDGGGEVDTDVSTDATSGDDSSGGGSGPVTSAPTSGGTPGSADDGDADGDSSSDSEASETAGITSGELDDEGCGCRSDAPPAGALLLLGLLGLRRRRR